MSSIARGVAICVLASSGAVAACAAAAPQRGDVRFELDAVVPAATEAVLCAYVALPRDRGELYIGAAESHYDDGGHHLVAFRTNLARVPDGEDTLHECGESGWNSNITGYYYEAQARDARRDLPAGVAHRFHPGEVLLVQVHTVNASGAARRTNVALTLRAALAESVVHEAGTLFFYNPKIHVAPRSARTVKLTCPVTADVHLALLWSHMHARGVAFDATSSDGSVLYGARRGSEPVPRIFDGEGMLLRAGSSITFDCDYTNEGNLHYVSGPSAITDEMCVLHGMYWPRAGITMEMCDEGTTDGEGHATADATLDCLRACAFAGDSACTGACWDDASPRAATHVAAALRCMQRDDLCEEHCGLGRGEACDRCMGDRCPRAIAALGEGG